MTDENDNVLVIDATLTIPRAELGYKATRSGGPGGQHVNTSSTRIELVWDVAASPSLTGEQRARLLEKLATRIDSEGQLHMDASSSRSQHRNREDVTERFRTLIAQALKVPKKRRPTKPPRASKEARLKEKKQRGEVKRSRSRIDSDD
jgi:ribosome-associated protein